MKWTFFLLVASCHNASTLPGDWIYGFGDATLWLLLTVASVTIKSPGQLVA